MALSGSMSSVTASSHLRVPSAEACSRILVGGRISAISALGDYSNGKPPNAEIAVEVDFGPLGASARAAVRRSKWSELPPPPPAEAAVDLRGSVDLTHGGRARSLLLDALRTKQLSRHGVTIRLIGRSAPTARAEGRAGAAPIDTYQRAISEVEIARASISFLEMDADDAERADDRVAEPSARTRTVVLRAPPAPSTPSSAQARIRRGRARLGRAMAEARVHISGVEHLAMLHRIHRLHLADQTRPEKSAKADARRRDASTDADGARDIIDAQRDQITDAAVAHSDACGSLALSTFFPNPDASHLRALLPRLSTLSTLDLSYSLSLDGPLVASTLEAMPQARRVVALRDARARAV